MEKQPSFLASRVEPPELVLYCLPRAQQGPVVHSRLLLMTGPLITFLPIPDRAALALTSVSRDELPNKLLALGSSCQGLLLGNPTKDTVKTTSEHLVRPMTEWADTPLY